MLLTSWLTWLRGTVVARFFLSFKGILATGAVMIVSVVLSRTLSHFTISDRNFYEFYNNFLIFRNAFFHLVQQKDIYLLYKSEAWDLYKYSPAFALLMAPIAVLPKLAGLAVWDSINMFTLFLAVWKMPHLREKQKILILWFIILELFGSLQNSQSNGLIAGLLVLSFNAFEKRNLALASLCIVGSVFIKLFGAVGFALFLFYPSKGKFIAYAALWTLLLGVLPLVAVSPRQLLFLYGSWRHVLGHDYGGALGLSVMGWLRSWFHITVATSVVTLTGIIVFCIPFLRFRLFHNPLYRIQLLASILIWVVIFNHMAESPTFIIASTGIALWYFSQTRTILNLVLLTSAYVLVSLSPTDLTPELLRKKVFGPYGFKVAPCIFIWIKLIFDMVTDRVRERIQNVASP